MGVPGWMGVLDANGWSAVAAACSAVAAAVSLMVAWNAKGIQGRSADFANCIEVAEQLRDAMRRVRDERDKDDKEAPPSSSARRSHIVTRALSFGVLPSSGVAG